MDRVKPLIAKAKAWYESLLERWGWLRHVLKMLDWYSEKRGNAYAAAISFIGILALVPIVMVSFSVAGFVLAWNPDLLTSLTDSILEKLPGDFGKQLNSIIDSAIASRTTVGVIGLVSAAFTGIGWIGLMRTAITEMWGGRVKANAVMTKLYDLAMFVVLGVIFALTMALTVVSSGDLGQKTLEVLGFDDGALSTWLLRIGSTIIQVAATWMLFVVVLAVMPRNDIPIRAILWTALGTALVFEVLKSVGGLYLRSVLSSPAGAAFGPILGVMVFAYLATRIVLYAAAWSASAEENEVHLIHDELESRAPDPTPVVLSPVYEARPQREVRRLVTAAGVGAAFAGAAGLLRRRPRDR